MKLIGDIRVLKSLLKYYGNDARVALIISSNLTPIQKDKLFNNGHIQYLFPLRTKVVN